MKKNSIRKFLKKLKLSLKKSWKKSWKRGRFGKRRRSFRKSLGFGRRLSRGFGRRRRFGSSEYGPGYMGQTSFENAVAAPYFGSQENFINPPEFFLPVADNQYQSPQMLQNWN
jgi:hypothetical protein